MSLYSGLTSYWSCDEVSGTTVHDSIGSVDGSYGYAKYTTGKINNCLRFARTYVGSSSIGVYCGNNYDNDGTQPMSWSFWIYANTFGGFPINKQTQPTSAYNLGYFMRWLSDGRQLVFYFSNSTTKDYSVTTPIYPPNTGWFHFVVTYDGSMTMGGVKIYSNGNLVASGSTGATLSGSYSNTAQLVFGNYYVNSWGYIISLYSNLDEIGYWNRVLTADEAKALYQDGIGKALSDLSNPTVLTSAATNVSFTTFTGNGNVLYSGDSVITNRGFCWSFSDITPTTGDSYITVTGTTGIFSANITGLTDNTTYYYRAFTSNSSGTTYGSIKTFKTESLPPPTDLPTPFCDGSHWTASGSTCGNSDGYITIVSNPLFISYMDVYDFTLTDVWGNTYIATTGGTFTGLTSGYYFLTATVKPAYWYYYGKETCNFDWIKVEDADNPAFLVNVSVRPLQCQPFDRQFGRIFYNVSGLTSGHTYSFYAFTSDLSLYYSATGITSTEGFILANADAECYWVIIRDETTGCALLLDNRCVPSLNLFSQGGVKKLYIAKWSDDVDYNYWSTADDDYFLEFTDTSFFTSTKIKEFLSLTGGTTGITWYELPVASKAVQLNQKLEKVRQGFIFTDTLTFAVSKGNATKWTAMATLLNPENKWMFVVQDADGFWWCGGYKHGARITAYNFKTGLRSEDDGYSLEVKAVSENKILTSLDEDYVINYIQ